MRLGNFFALRGRPNDAEFQYKAALRLDHGFSAAAINLADLYRQTGRSQLEETTIRQAISFAPRDAAVNHAHGLFTVRRGDLRDALSYLQSAAESDRDNGHSVEAIKYAKMLLAAYPSARGKLLESLEGTSKNRPRRLQGPYSSPFFTICLRRRAKHVRRCQDDNRAARSA
jgi:Flp pilus assembly protein TadD